MTQPENQIAHSKPNSSQEYSTEAHPAPSPNIMKSAFTAIDTAGQERTLETNGTFLPNGATLFPSQEPQALGDPSTSNSDPENGPEETNKKWGFSSLLSRGRSDSVPSKTDTTNVVPAAPLTTISTATTKGGWFIGKRSRHSTRANSADPVLSSPLPETVGNSSNSPTVGGLPLIKVHLPADAPPLDNLYETCSIQGGNGGNSSPRRGISVSAPVSTTVTPNIEVLTLPGNAALLENGGGGGCGGSVGNGKEKKGPTHRRHRSLLETLGWSKPPKSVASNASHSGDLDSLEDADKSNDSSNRSGGDGVAVAVVLGGHDDGNTNTNNNKSGRISTDIELLEVELPPSVPFATRGLSNMGNSCFLNAAIQCLRHTPGLPLILVPDLLEKAEQRAKEQAEVEAQAAHAAVEAKLAREKEEEEGALRVDTELESAPKETVAALSKMSTGVARTSTAAPGADEVSMQCIQPTSAPANEENVDAAAVVTTATTLVENVSAPTVGEEKKEIAASVTTAPIEPTQAAVPPSPAPLPRPCQGELASAVAALFTELYLNPVTTTGNGYSPAATTAMAPAVSPLTLLSVLRRFPTAADYFDGRQQDCQEVLQILLDLLHEDLNRVVPPKTKKEEEEEEEKDDGNVDEKHVENNKNRKQLIEDNEDGVIKDGVQAVRSASTGLPPRPPTPSTSPLNPPPLLPPPPQIKNNNNNNSADDESIKADCAWSSWRRTTDSPISDLFMGQLQSSVTCSKCNGRFTMYEPFFELSLPLAPKSGGAFSWLTFKPGGSSLSLQDCIRAFTTDEKLDGKEAFSCEKCGEKTAATKHLRLHRLPEALVLHVKRFKHGGAGGGGDKLTTDVIFPVHSLDLHGHLSPESPHPSEECIYDLYAVSYHTGTLAGGHYVACCRLSPPTPTPPEDNTSDDCTTTAASTSNDNSGATTITTNNIAAAVDGTSSSLSSPLAAPIVRAGSIDSEKKVNKSKKKDKPSTPSWWLFNDETVSPVVDDNVKTQNAYILFYARRKFKDSNAAAAVFASRDAKGKTSAGEKGGIGIVSGYHHRRSVSSGGSGSGGASFLFGNRNKVNITTTASPTSALAPAAVAAVASKEEGNDSC